MRLLTNSTSIPVKYRLVLNNPRTTRICPYAALQMCLTNEHGEAFLHRFQFEHEKAVTFFGPMMGNIDAVYLSPECGEWELSDFTLEYLEQVDNFASDDSCSFSKVHPKVERKEVTQAGNEEYDQLKQQLAFSTVAFTIAGATVVEVATGWADAQTFVFGGIAGLLYQLLLQLDIDQICKKDTNLLLNALTSSAVRLALLGALFALALQPQEHNAAVVLYAGFFMQKIALIAVYALKHKK